MPYCEACSTQYDDKIEICKVCGSKLVLNDENNTNINNADRETQKSNLEQNENEKSISGNVKQPLINQVSSTLTLFKSFQATLVKTILNLSILKPMAVIIFSLFFITGGYWGYIKYLSRNGLLVAPTVIESHEEVKTQLQSQSFPPDHLFDLIKKANITKDIDLFMSCFSPNFKLLDNKKANRLKVWNEYDYNSLKYNIKGFVILKDKASGLVEWEFYARQKNTEKKISAMFLYNVVLEKDNKGAWKILSMAKL